MIDQVAGCEHSAQDWYRDEHGKLHCSECQGLSPDHTSPQPAPMVNTHPMVWPDAIDRLRSRSMSAALLAKIVTDCEAKHEGGVKKYKTALRPYNGRDPLIDAYQEALDCYVYSVQHLIENPGPTGTVLLYTTQSLVIEIASILMNRGKL